MNGKEIAKFFCGVEAFHAWVHAFFLFSGTTLTVFGITTNPTLNVVGVVVNAIVSVALGLYAWRPAIGVLGTPRTAEPIGRRPEAHSAGRNP